MDDKKRQPRQAASSILQDNGNALQPQYSPAATQAPPPPTQSSYDNIPAELRERPQWIAANSKKEPVNPHTGRLASPTDPGTWGSFAQACAYAGTHGLRIGFVFTAGDPYCGIDLDRKTGDEAEAKLHRKILDAFPSYTERSTSGAGYHIIVKAMLSHGRRRDSVEAYSYARYFIFTGNVVRQAPIIEAQMKVDALVNEMPAAKVGVDLVDIASPYTDEQVRATARGARNGKKYDALCACTSCTGEGVQKVHGTYTQLGYTSQSEADHALLSIIAFYTRDNAQVRRLFRSTGLGKRDKAIKDNKYINTSLKKIRAEQAERENTAQQEFDVAKWIATIESAAPGALPTPADTDTDDDLPPIPGPEVTPAMYYGLVGEVMRQASTGTEVNPAAAGIAFISAASAALGRERYVSIGNDRHHSRIYSAHVGRSSRGGKGIALGATKRICTKAQNIRNANNPPYPFACGNFHDGGLSSREGLSWLIRDKSDEKDKNNEPIDPGVDDKRLFVVEEEFANVLKQAAREGNTLSTALRTAWDGATIAPATKTNRTRASDPHIAMHACITPYELRLSLDQNNFTNGFANRFLFVWAERIGMHPEPLRMPDDVVEELAKQLLKAIEHAQQPGEARATEAARKLFAVFYREHRRGTGLTEKLRGLLERQPPYAWRLALTFALLDCKDVIDDKHMEAAIAWLEYCRESTRFIFSDARQEAQVGRTTDLSNKIIEQLQRAHEQTMNRESLHKALGKPSKDILNAALQQLKDACNLDEISTPREGGGRSLRQYRLKGIAPPPPQGCSKEGTA